MDPYKETKKRGWARYTESMKRQHTASFKAQVVQELLKEEKTIAQIAAEYEVHPTQLRRWKSIVVDGLPGLFEEKDSLSTVRAEYEERLNELYGDIGRLTTQLTWLKKKSGLEPEPR
jgi:transposase